LDWTAQRDSAKAASSNPVDRAMAALARGDYADVRRQMSRIPLDRRATDAKVWSDLAWDIYGTQRDTAKAYLRLARESLVRSRPDSATFDDLAAVIADRQFWVADHTEGVATVNLIHDAGHAASVIHGWGMSTFSGLNATRLRDLANGVRLGRAQNAALLRVVAGYLTATTASPQDLEWAKALADSIRTPAERLEARLAVAHARLARRDTAAARAEFVTLLGDSIVAPALAVDGGRKVITPLVMVGAQREAEVWARSERILERRVRKLIALAEVWYSLTDGRNIMQVAGDGPDMCLDAF